MKKAGLLWTLNEDEWFQKRLAKTGDKFEYDHLEKALLKVTDWSCALDVGAHYGSWTRYMAKQFDKVIAFEGRVDTYECLVENTKKLLNVKIYNKAIGEELKNVTVAQFPKYKKIKKNSGLSSVLGPGKTPMITIDSLNLPSLGFLKLDIEGYEIFALKGALQTLYKFKPIVILEDNKRCMDFGFQRGDTCKFIETLGATCVDQINDDYIFEWKIR